MGGGGEGGGKSPYSHRYNTKGRTGGGDTYLVTRQNTPGFGLSLFATSRITPLIFCFCSFRILAGVYYTDLDENVGRVRYSCECLNGPYTSIKSV